MSLYYEAAKVLEDIVESSKPLKQCVYNDKSLKSSPGAVFALVSEAAKWSEILTKVIDNSGILAIEPKLTPALSLVLSHDLLLSKKGLSASRKHPLFDLISKHKARLTAELTRIRVKKGVQSIDALRAQINSTTTSPNGESAFYPRWVRINTIKTTLEACLASTFKSHTRVSTLASLATQTSPTLYIDLHIPSLIALHPASDLTKTPAYTNGHIILQDKASCFPAYLLSPVPTDGQIIDATAAPGNKTTHLAALLAPHAEAKQIVACERAADRARTLTAMVARAGAAPHVSVLAGQDFLALSPADRRWARVGALLLDPSCSGSGIVGRDADAPLGVCLPAVGVPPGRKRKRTPPVQSTEEQRTEEQEVQPPGEEEVLAARLRQLAAFQLRIVTHAMAFPAARRITYSTCSVHGEENEAVAARALGSDVARARGWRVLGRQEQVDGLRRWERRGDGEACMAALRAVGDVGVEPERLREACIRADKGTGEGTMGFFVVGFVRDVEVEGDGRKQQDEDDDGEWSGFSD